MHNYLRMCKKSSTFVADYEKSVLIFTKGEMLEWLKRHAWKACKLQKGFRGSNPRLSAKDFTKDASPSLLELNPRRRESPLKCQLIQKHK